MSDTDPTGTSHDTAPGDDGFEPEGIGRGIRGYCIGLALALLLTGCSFWAVSTNLIYGPAVPVALVTFAIAQMGVHLVFFLHITSGPDNVNNVLALAFGVLIVFLVIAGSLWIMANLSASMMPMNQAMEMMR